MSSFELTLASTLYEGVHGLYGLLNKVYLCETDRRISLPWCVLKEGPGLTGTYETLSVGDWTPVNTPSHPLSFQRDIVFVFLYTL